MWDVIIFTITGKTLAILINDVHHCSNVPGYWGEAYTCNQMTKKTYYRKSTFELQNWFDFCSSQSLCQKMKWNIKHWIHTLFIPTSYQSNKSIFFLFINNEIIIKPDNRNSLYWVSTWAAQNHKERLLPIYHKNVSLKHNGTFKGE